MLPVMVATSVPRDVPWNWSIAPSARPEQRQAKGQVQAG